MALPCPDARQCCAIVCTTLSPEAMQGFSAQQGWIVAPMPIPMQIGAWASSYENAPWAQSFSSSTADVSLGMGAPLAYGFGSDADHGKPVQVLMGAGLIAGIGQVGWHAPCQLAMGSNMAVAGDKTASSWSAASESMTSRFGAISGSVKHTLAPVAPAQLAMEDFGHSPASHSEEPPVSDLACKPPMSNSMLRRRRRQRAAAKVPLSVSREDDADKGDEEASAEVESLAEAEVLRLVQDLIRQSRADEEGRRCAAARFRRLAFTDKSSSRVAQLALEEPGGAALVVGMHGHVRAAMRSMYANYVIQKIVEVMPSASIGFVVQELVGVGQEVSRHRFGCRVFCRLLEHCSLEDPCLALLVDEVLADAGALSCHVFGNYVVRHILEFGFPHYRRWIAQALYTQLSSCAANQFGSRVVETALDFCCPEDQHLLVCELLRNPGQLVALAMHLSGRHVVKALLRRPSEEQQVALTLRPYASQLRASKYGKPVWDLIDATSR